MHLGNRVLAILVLALSLFSPLIRAELAEKLSYAPPGPSCPETGIDQSRNGGELPDPLTVYNQRVELAPGELYLLVGTIKMLPDLQGRTRKLLPYFEVGFKEQPWLGNAIRKTQPFYSVRSTSFNWRELDGQPVRLAARARVSYVLDPNGEVYPFHELEVIPEASSVPFKARD